MKMYLILACLSMQAAVVYDPNLRPAAFAAREIELAGRVEGVAEIRLELDASSKTGDGGFEIRRVAADRIVVTGATPRGVMYGGLELAERIRLKQPIPGAITRKPHIENRGIKFNLPLDVRTPSYSDNADAAQNNIAEMWSFDFWREFLDAMARHRYNTLSLWNLHPFPSMVKVPEFPDVALADVQRTLLPFDETYSHNGTDMVRPHLLTKTRTLRAMRIEDKIRFWRDVMQYAKDRGIDVYVFTWNIFTFGATGKYGITPEQTNEKTIAYFRASVREMVTTYPLLAGMGITAGEEMKNLEGQYSKEKWLWRTYGEGIRDGLKATPQRPFRLIHRYHQTAQGEIFDAFKEYPRTMDLSFKYSVAHMYSIPNPPYIQQVLPELRDGRRTWLTVRNDDVYSFRWGNSQYVRDYIRAIPGADKIAGFYMGPDGFTWGRDFLSKDAPGELVIHKQWFSFLLWGRLAFDPDLTEDRLTAIVAERFPGRDVPALRKAWAAASMTFPLITRFAWGDIDLKWFPEASLSHPRYKGYWTVRDFMSVAPMPGSNVQSIPEWRKQGTVAGWKSPFDLAAELERESASALATLPAKTEDREWNQTVTDIEAMATLGHYYALKIEGAARLAVYDRTGKADDQRMAVEKLTAAVAAWRKYANLYTSQYRDGLLYNRVGFVHLDAITARTQDDVRTAQQWRLGTMPQDEPDKLNADRVFAK